MEIKKYLLAVICLFLLSCKTQSKKDNSFKEKNNPKQSTYENEINIIKSFYIECYQKGSGFDEKIIDNYLTEDLINLMESLRDEDNYILSYDPFIKGQDYNPNILLKSLKIKSTDKPNEFSINLKLFSLDEDYTNIILGIKKYRKKYLINSVINNNLLNPSAINKYLKRKESKYSKFDNWKGIYHFSLEDLTRMGETYSVYFDFDISDISKPKVVSQLDKENKKIRSCEVTHITKDTLVLMDKQKNSDIYVLTREGDNYAVSGSPIYILNPPNETYPLSKE